MFDRPALALGGNISLPHVFSGKDRAFFFVSYEPTRDRETTGRQITAPLASFIDRTSCNFKARYFEACFRKEGCRLRMGPVRRTSMVTD